MKHNGDTGDDAGNFFYREFVEGQPTDFSEYIGDIADDKLDRLVAEYEHLGSARTLLTS